MTDIVQRLMRSSRAFAAEAHAILGRHESSPSRVVLLEDSYRKLTALSLKQDELMRQALRCMESELYRASHVMAWAGFMDFLEEKLASDSFARLHAERPKWVFGSIEELRETVVEHQIVEVTMPVGLCAKSEMKALLGLLNKRNECAHPSNFFPGLNESLGYFSELLKRIEALRKKTL
jgi:hypothetical protein